MPDAPAGENFPSRRPLTRVWDFGEAPAQGPAGEAMLEELDRLSAVIAAREAELRRLRHEVELRDLYIQELHVQLRRQAERLERIEQLVRRVLPPAIKRGLEAEA